jgi:hypothetical protein
LTLPTEQQSQLLEAPERTPSSQPGKTEEASVSIPLFCKIEELKNKCGPDPLWSTSLPGTSEPSLRLQERSKTLDWQNMDAMLAHFAPEKQILTKDVMLRVFASPGVATILAEWKANVLDPDALKEEEELCWALTCGDHTNRVEAELLASCAWYLPQVEAERIPFDHDYKNGIMQCAPTLRKLAEGMKPYVMQHLDPSVFPEIERFLYELCTRIVIMAYTELYVDNIGNDGFFAVLLASEFAKPRSPEAREKWEDHLGLDHKVLKQSPEFLNPFISIHTAALAYSPKWGLEKKKRKDPDDRVLKVSERAITSNTRLPGLQGILHGEADSIPRLLAAFDVTAPPLPPAKLPQRIIRYSTISQPSIPVAPKQAQRKRRRAAKAMVEDGAISKTGKPKVATNLQTPTYTATDVSSPLEKIATPESNMHGSASGKKRKVTAASTSPNSDLSTDNKKRGRKANATKSTSGPTHREPQEDAVSTPPKDVIDSQEDEGDVVAVTIEDAAEVPELNPKPTIPPIEDNRFSSVNGRIVPSIRRTIPRAKSDCFTDRE